MARICASSRCIERRARLEEIIPADGAIQLSQHLEGDGAAFFAEADRLGLEGIVSKKASAPYRSGRTETWLKIKCFEESIYEIAAVLRERGKPPVAYMVDARCGAPLCRRRLHQRPQPRHARTALGNASRPRPGHPRRASTMKPGAEWLKPGLIGHVRHLKGEELLRHATLREIGD